MLGPGGSGPGFEAPLHLLFEELDARAAAAEAGFHRGPEVGLLLLAGQGLGVMATAIGELGLLALERPGGLIRPAAPSSSLVVEGGDPGLPQRRLQRLGGGPGGAGKVSAKEGGPRGGAFGQHVAVVDAHGGQAAAGGQVGVVQVEDGHEGEAKGHALPPRGLTNGGQQGVDGQAGHAEHGDLHHRVVMPLVIEDLQQAVLRRGLCQLGGLPAGAQVIEGVALGEGAFDELGEAVAVVLFARPAHTGQHREAGGGAHGEVARQTRGREDPVVAAVAIDQRLFLHLQRDARRGVAGQAVVELGQNGDAALLSLRGGAGHDGGAEVGDEGRQAQLGEGREGDLEALTLGALLEAQRLGGVGQPALGQGGQLQAPLGGGVHGGAQQAVASRPVAAQVVEQAQQDLVRQAQAEPDQNGPGGGDVAAVTIGVEVGEAIVIGHAQRRAVLEAQPGPDLTAVVDLALVLLGAVIQADAQPLIDEEGPL